MQNCSWWVLLTIWESYCHLNYTEKYIKKHIKKCGYEENTTKFYLKTIIFKVISSEGRKKNIVINLQTIGAPGIFFIFVKTHKNTGNDSESSCLASAFKHLCIRTNHPLYKR